MKPIVLIRFHKIILKEIEKMKFPNAFSGVKKIFAAEILQIIGILAMGFAAIFVVFAGVGVEADNALVGLGSLFGAGAFSFGGIIVLLLAAIFEIVGLSKAGKDEKFFKYALYMVILGVVASVVGSFFQSSNTTIYSVCDSVNRLCDLISTVLIVQGIMNLANALGNAEMVAKGAVIFKAITFVYVLAIIGTISYGILASFVFLRIISIVCLCFSLVLSFVSYILFLSYLAKAKRMLLA